MPLKKFNIVVGQTDAEGSPPPPPAPSGPPQDRFHPESQFGIADGYSGTYGGSSASPQMYYTKRYSSEAPRYASAYQPQSQGYGSVQANPVADLPSYYTSRYTDYSSRYPTYTSATTPEATSPGWRRRSYDPDVDYNVASRRVQTASSVTSSFGRPLTDLTGGAGGATAASLALARSRSRSRVSASELEPTYMNRYMTPTVTTPSTLLSSLRPASATSSSSRPMSSGYLYSHGPGAYTGYHYVGSVSGGADLPPHAPPGYSGREREVSARIRRYQQQPPPES